MADMSSAGFTVSKAQEIVLRDAADELKRRVPAVTVERILAMKVATPNPGDEAYDDYSPQQADDTGWNEALDAVATLFSSADAPKSEPSAPTKAKYCDHESSDECGFSCYIAPESTAQESEPPLPWCELCKKHHACDGNDADECGPALSEVDRIALVLARTCGENYATGYLDFQKLAQAAIAAMPASAPSHALTDTEIEALEFASKILYTRGDMSSYGPEMAKELDSLRARLRASDTGCA